MRRVVTLFGSSRTSPNDANWELAYRFGRAVAEAGFDLATGGYGGAMAAASQGAREAGALVIGVTAPPVFPQRAGPNPYVELELPSPSLLVRIERLLDLGSVYFALPGGVGTFTEIAAAWNRAFIARNRGETPKPILLHASWRELIRPGLEITENELSLLTFVESPDEVREFLASL